MSQWWVPDRPTTEDEEQPPWCPTCERIIREDQYRGDHCIYCEDSMTTDLNKPLRDYIQRDMQSIEKLSRFCDLLNEELPPFSYAIVAHPPFIRFSGNAKAALVEQFGEDDWLFDGSSISKEVHGVRLVIEQLIVNEPRKLTAEEMLSEMSFAKTI